MSTEIDMREIKKESFRDSQLDGITELMAGIVLFFTSVMILTGISAAFLGLFVLFLIPSIEKFRKKLIYPRIGYATYHQENSTKEVKGILLFILIAFVLWLIALFVLNGEIILDADVFFKWIPALIGVILIGPSLYLGSKSGNLRYYVFGAMTFISGVGFSLLDFEPPINGMVFYLLFWGLILIIVGSIKLVLFLQKYPEILVGDDHDEG